MIEFEVKAPVPADALTRVRDVLGEPEAVLHQVDTYFAHPSRNFGESDEALRLRVVEDHAELTYKGPKLQAGSKARREVTMPVPDPGALITILTSVGFREFAVVRKVRRVHRHAGFEAALDEVDGLDTAFLELERTLPGESLMEDARTDALAALEALGLTDTERRSYLELLLANTNRSSA